MAIKVKYLSEDEIEKHAKLLLAEYEDTIGEPIKLPVRIDDITIHHLALGLDFADLHQVLNIPLSGGNPDILGAIYVDKELVLHSLAPDFFCGDCQVFSGHKGWRRC